ncbi:hypothetical protein CVS40_6703 [Lucilia cuprina]|nr:hypothetical protein CVS40_6703 [Lucilia cuprina]
MSRRKQSKPRAFLKLGETSSSGATAEECEDPLALLDPKEELLSETESLEMEDENKSDAPADMDINHKLLALAPTQPALPPAAPPLSSQEASAATITLPAITNNNNDHLSETNDSANKVLNIVNSEDLIAADNNIDETKTSKDKCNKDLLENNHEKDVNDTFNEFNDLDDDVDDEDLDEDLLSLDSYYSASSQLCLYSID